jgi:phosphotransferase system enzyme I (PtsI)
MHKGIPASPGIAIGKAYVIVKKEHRVLRRVIEDPIMEKVRFHQALEETKAHMDSMIKSALDGGRTESAAIFEAHHLILEDPELISTVEARIDAEKVNAEFALENALEYYINLLAQMDNVYMRERAADLKDVGYQILNFLSGNSSSSSVSTLPQEESIIVASELAPSNTANLVLEKVQGFLTELGGPTSHTAIIARSLEIPAVVGVDKITTMVKNGDLLIIDGREGIVLINPASKTIQEYRNKQEKEAREKKELASVKNSPSRTKDGKEIRLLANIGDPREIIKALEYEAAGIGLYRTEFLFMNQKALPSEEEQFLAYKEVLEKMEGKPVIIRTLDIGGDKELPYLPMESEMNPFLGCRAIRLCLQEKDLFRTQLRALYRASVYGQLWIMFPMVSGIEEYRAARAFVEEVKSELIKEGQKLSPKIPIGIMVEIPSTAIIADLFAKEADFFSIGTNDLIQYTLAVDRMNERLSYLYDPFHPAVLRMIKMVIESGRREGIEVCMCGEMAGDPHLTPILIGLGLESFSMGPASLFKVKKNLRDLKLEDTKVLAEKVLQLPTAEEIKSFLGLLSH